MCPHHNVLNASSTTGGTILQTLEGAEWKKRVTGSVSMKVTPDPKSLLHCLLSD